MEGLDIQRDNNKVDFFMEIGWDGVDSFDVALGKYKRNAAFKEENKLSGFTK